MTRYALWLAPIGAPLFAAASTSTRWRLLLLVMAIISVPMSLVAYRPSVPEFAYRPTWIARWVWHHAPGWSRPLPEIFANVLGQHELPAWMSACDFAAGFYKVTAPIRFDPAERLRKQHAYTEARRALAADVPAEVVGCPGIGLASTPIIRRSASR